MDQKQAEQSRKYTNQAIIGRTVGTGFFMGLAFYFFWLMITTFNFTHYPIYYYIQRSLTLILDAPKWFEVILVGTIFTGISILLSLLYYMVAKKWVSIWLGILYGGIISAVHIFIIHPLFVGESLLFDSYGSIISIICLHVLFGLSIGFSVSFDYTESLAHRKQIEENKKTM